MLKKVSIILLATLIFSCASEPTKEVFKGTGNFDTAEAAKTRVSLGLTYLKNGNFSQAKFNLDKALEFAPRSGEANYAMAFYYQQVEEVERAHEYYKKAISLSRNDPDITNSYGAFLCKEGDYEQAKKYFLKSVDDKSYISTASTYENLAICSETQGKLDEAILYFNSALNHQPTRASSLLYLTQLYIKKERWDEAKRALWKYERNARVTAESLWLSFQIARGQQDLKASLEYAEILKRLHPNDMHTQKAINALGKFQPDMAVTQKTRVTSNGTENENIVKKATRELAPIEDTAPANITKGPVLIADTKVIPGIGSDVQTNKENDTELALHDALENNSEKLAKVEVEMDDTLTRQGTAFHIVKPKENLYRISLKYNVKINKLLEWNELTDMSSIRIGTKLWVRDPNSNE